MTLNYYSKNFDLCAKRLKSGRKRKTTVAVAFNQLPPYRRRISIVSRQSRHKNLPLSRAPTWRTPRVSFVRGVDRGISGPCPKARHELPTELHIGIAWGVTNPTFRPCAFASLKPSCVQS